MSTIVAYRFSHESEKTCAKRRFVSSLMHGPYAGSHFRESRNATMYQATSAVSWHIATQTRVGGRAVYIHLHLYTYIYI